MSGFQAVSRRSVLAGMAGAGLAAALGVTLGKAQESTPAASETPQAGTSTGNALDALLQKLDSIISQVKTDRDAVSSTIDVSVVDQLLSKAAALRDQVASTASTGNQQAYQLAQAVIALARAAAAVIQAELSNYGLPSQQARASRVVANAHGQITEISDLVSNSTDANVTESIALAQQLYQAAYDAYNAGTYTKAMALARAATAVAFAAALAGGVAAGKFGIGREGPDEEDGPFGPGMPGGKKRGGRGHMERDMPDWGGQPDWGESSETDQPVEVPAPNFTS